MKSFNSLGSSQPQVVLYIENVPLWDNDQPLNIPQLITDNGNHWRKILTIFAKLTSNNDWRLYRDHQLLHTAQQINFSNLLNPITQIHIFAGKACWQRFGLTDDTLEKLHSTACKKVFYRYSTTQGLMLYTPYFDYRQFPNALIAQVKQIINEVLTG